MIGLLFGDLAVNGRFKILQSLPWKASALINSLVLILIFVFSSVPGISQILDFVPWYIQLDNGLDDPKRTSIGLVNGNRTHTLWYEPRTTVTLVSTGILFLLESSVFIAKMFETTVPRFLGRISFMLYLWAPIVQVYITPHTANFVIGLVGHNPFIWMPLEGLLITLPIIVTGGFILTKIFDEPAMKFALTFEKYLAAQ